jgi:predicted MFS family arabinose efflux permease
VAQRGAAGGLTFLSHQVGAFVGAWLGGVTFDMTGSYAVAWGLTIAVGLGAAALQWFMDDCREPDRWPAGLGEPMYTD